MAEELVFKYAPKNFSELILSDEIKSQLEESLKTLPTMFLSGQHGVGKGSFTHVFLNETNVDYIWVNGGSEKGIDTVRTKIETFAVSLGSSNIKYVVFNEIDRITPDAQKSLLDLIERVHEFTRFIFMANRTSGIYPELLSRCNIYHFSNPPAKEIFKRCCYILESEKIEIKKNIVLEIVKKCYPDIRQTIRTINKNIVGGKLVDNILIYDRSEIYNEIINCMKDGSDSSIEKIRKSLRSNYIDYIELYEMIYLRIDGFENPGNIMLKLGDAVRAHNFVALPEINFMAFVVEVLNGR